MKDIFFVYGFSKALTYIPTETKAVSQAKETEDDDINEVLATKFEKVNQYLVDKLEELKKTDTTINSKHKAVDTEVEGTNTNLAGKSGRKLKI